MALNPMGGTAPASPSASQPQDDIPGNNDRSHDPSRRRFACRCQQEWPRDYCCRGRPGQSSGRLESAIELLDGARQSARCRRDRFIRQLELVELCLHRGLTHVARPLIDELAGEQETRNLEDWEDPELCARVLMASLACLRASAADHDGQRIPGILERLYRLDPRSALRRDMMP